jgi:hypothetical protein
MKTSDSNRLRVDLDYYPGHAALLQQGAYSTLGTTNKVASFQNRGEISRQDFLNYFLIHRSLSPDYATYAARLDNIDQSITWLRNAISMHNGTINALPGARGVQEHVGEAISLSIANVMFGLTEADWGVIPVQRGRRADPTFDFEGTWTGVSMSGDVVQIEAKGSLVQNCAEPTHPNVKMHARNIANKKAKIEARGQNYRHPASVRFGMIAAIDHSQTARCWLLDPESDQISEDPLDLKMAFRIEYVASMIELMAPKATLVDALRRRAKIWRRGASQMNFGPVQSPRGFAFSRQNYVEDFLSVGKVWLPEYDIVGKVFHRNSGTPFFVGLRGDVIRSAIGQVRAEVLESEFEPTTFIDLPVNQFDNNVAQGNASRGARGLAFHVSTSGGVVGVATG